MADDAVPPLSPRSQKLKEQAEKCMELHCSEDKMSASKQLLRMPRKAEQLSASYRVIRRLFSAAVDIFYHYIEVVGADNLPPPGNAAILCPNHGNSLTDAAVCVSQTPRMVRMTAKDTLFNVPYFGVFIRNVGTVPLQRGDEHKEGVDNRAAVTLLNEELLKGQMVCLFPEGRSRFHWKVDDIKYGVASIAYNTLKTARERGNMDFTLSLCPTAFNYLHREKFRSGLVVEYSPPLILTPRDELMGLEKPAAMQRISESVQRLMSLTAYHAEDWNTLRIAHTARNLFAPLGTRMTIVEYVNRTKYWAAALSVNDPRDPKLREDLTAYQDAIEAVHLKDRRISRDRGSTAWMLWSIVARLGQVVLLSVPALVGAVMWSPIFYLCKHMEQQVMRRKKKPTHVDEVAQYKLVIGTMLLPPITLFFAGLVTYALCSWWHFPFVALLMACFMWIAIRVIEDLFATLRSLRALATLLVMPESRFRELQKQREDLQGRVVRRAELCGNLKPPEVSRPGFWFEVVSKFDPRRRRKKDWNEVLRLYEVLPVDYKAIERVRSSAALEEESKKTR